MPADGEGERRNDRGSEERADVGAGIEECGGEGAFLAREPLRDGLDGGGEVAAFAEAEGDAGDAKAGDGAHEGVSGGGKAPRGDGDGVADLGAVAVDEPAEGEVAEGVGTLEERVDPAELLVGPVEFLVEDGLQQRQDLPVHVVDARSGEEQAADEPAVAADREIRRNRHQESDQRMEAARSCMALGNSVRLRMRPMTE